MHEHQGVHPPEGGHVGPQHRLSGTGRTNKQNVMPACSCYFHRAFYTLLSFDICKIDRVMLILRKYLAHIYVIWLEQAMFTCKEFNRLAQISHRIDFYAFHHSGFFRIFLRE